MFPRIHFAPALLALAAVAAAVATLFLPDAAAVLLGAAPAGLMFAGAGAVDLGKLVETNEQIEGAVKEFMAKIERRLARPGQGNTGGASAAPVSIRDSKGIEHRLFAKGVRIADHAPHGTVMGDDEGGLAEYVTEQVLGKKSVSRGPALVSTGLAGIIIDAVRDLTVVAEAGAGTLVLAGPSNATRISADPTVIQHTEGANDITQSDVTTAAVTLDPKALVARIPLTNEAIEDSANLEEVLRTSLAGAFAAKLNALCIATLLADASIPKSTVAHATATWQGTLLAVGAAMAAKQNLPVALIGNAADFIARASQLASTGGSWLGRPPALAAMKELPTTAIAAGLAVMGDFAAGFLLAARQELRLDVVRFSDAGRYSHELVAHARIDGYVVQPARLFNQKLVP